MRAPCAAIELPRFDLSHAVPGSFGTAAEALHFPVLLGQNQGMPRVPIYIFRDNGSNRSFAYSLDATGQDIPPLSEHTKWLFAAVIAAAQLEAHADTLRQLRTKSF